MSNWNTWSWIENNNFEPESNNNLDILAKAQIDFIWTKLQNNINYFDLKSSNILDKIWNDFKVFINTSNNYKKLWVDYMSYTDEQKNTINSQIKTEIIKNLYPRENNISKLSDIYKNDYNFSSKLFTKVINTIKEDNLWNIIKLLKSWVYRDEYLIKNNLFSDENELFNSKKDIKEDFLWKIDIKESEFNKLSKERQNFLYWLFKQTSQIILDDLDDLFLVLSESSKVSLLKYFFSSLSLDEIEKTWLLDNVTKNELKEKIKNNLQKYDTNLSNDDLEEIYNNLDKSDIFINLDDLDNNLLKWLVSNKDIKDKLLREYNKWINYSDDLDTKDSIYDNLNAVWVNNDINNSFIEYVQKDKDIKLEIRDNISNLNEWNYIELELWKNRWTYLIKKTDEWKIKNSKSIVLEDISAIWGIKKQWKWVEKKYDYNDFYNILKTISTDKEKKYSINFLDKKTFEAKDIPEIAEDNNIQTIIELKNKLDLVDVKWKDIEFSIDKMVFSWKDKNWEFIFNIDSIDEINKSIVIDEWNNKRTISFENLFTIFKNNKEKVFRKKKNNNLDDAIEDLSASWLDSFDWLTFNSKNELVPKKEKDNKDYKWVKYLIWSSWNKAIYIDKIKDGQIKYYLWTYKEWQKSDKEKGIKWKNDIFKWDYYSTNFTQFTTDIKNNNIVFDNKKSEELENKQEEINMKSSWFKRFMAGLSIMEIYEAFKFFPETIKAKLERWNRLKSLKLAKAIAWTLSSKDWDFYLTMKAKAAEEEKKLREEKMNELWSLWSKDMLKQIEEILLNKDSDPADLIASMFKVVAKYWTLYPKSLKKYKWSLIWYKRIWWAKEFELEYRKWLNEAKSPSWKPNPVSFTEERLIESFLWDQEKSWKVWPRTDKEFWNNLSAWIKEELEDWAMKSWNKATTSWRIDYFMWELWNLTFANAIGSLPKIFAKNDSAVDMHAAPFVLAISWFWKDLDQSLLNQLMDLAFTTPYTSLYFTKSEKEIKLYQKFIWKIIDTKYKDNKWMKNAFDSMLKITNPWSRVDAIASFWNKYWDLLIDSITLKDWFVLANKDIREFWDYYDALQWIQTDDEFVPKEDDIKIWIFDRSPVAMTWWLVWKIQSDTVWGFWWKVSKKIYKMYLSSLIDMKNNSNLDIEKKKKIFKTIFAKFENRVREVIWRFKEWDSIWSLPIIDWLIENNLQICNNNCKWDWYETFLDKSFENFMNWNINNLWDAENDTKIDIDDILNSWNEKNNIKNY